MHIYSTEVGSSKKYHKPIKMRLIRSFFFPLADETFTYLFLFLAESVKHDDLPLGFFRFTFSILSRFNQHHLCANKRSWKSSREYRLADKTYTYLLAGSKLIGYCQSAVKIALAKTVFCHFSILFYL